MADEKTMTLKQKLGAVQAELKSPKNAYNSFGGYKYRSLEMILESVKPLLNKYGLTMVIYDEPVQIGDRFYIKATAGISDGRDTIETSAYAREPDHKTKMDDAQVTGTSSSYARKYCLNGLFLIDDTKDPDTDEYHVEAENRGKKAAEKSRGTNTHESGQKAANDASAIQEKVNMSIAEESDEPCSDIEIATVEALCHQLGKEPEKYLAKWGWPNITKSQYVKVVQLLREKADGNKRTA